MSRWDRNAIAAEFVDPLFVAPDADDKEIDLVRFAVENSLNTVTARVYALAQSGSSHAVPVGPGRSAAWDVLTLT